LISIILFIIDQKKKILGYHFKSGIAIALHVGSLEITLTFPLSHAKLNQIEVTNNSEFLIIVKCKALKVTREKNIIF